MFLALTGQTYIFLAKDKYFGLGHGTFTSKVDLLMKNEPQYSLEKTLISYPFTKMYLTSRKLIRKHGLAQTRSQSGNKIRE